MIKFTNRQILEFYMRSGIPLDKCVNEREVVNIYKLLGISPRLKADGSREITPYEILGVMPVFDNGKEKPIVFAIKNKARKIGRYEGLTKTFFYMSKKIEEEKTVIESLKEKYRRAVFLGDIEQAEKILSALRDISSEDASKLIRSFYDYSRFYRKMKKQLAMDLFSHFFLMYMSSVLLSTKMGLENLERATGYSNENEEYQSSEASQSETVSTMKNMALNPAEIGIQRVVISSGEEGESVSVDFKKQKPKIPKPPVKNFEQHPVPPPPPTSKQEKNNEQPKPKMENIDMIPHMFERKNKRVGRPNGFLSRPLRSKVKHEETKIKSFENRYTNSKASKSHAKTKDFEAKYEY